MINPSTFKVYNHVLGLKKKKAGGDRGLKMTIYEAHKLKQSARAAAEMQMTPNCNSNNNRPPCSGVHILPSVLPTRSVDRTKQGYLSRNGHVLCFNIRSESGGEANTSSLLGPGHTKPTTGQAT